MLSSACAYMCMNVHLHAYALTHIQQTLTNKKVKLPHIGHCLFIDIVLATLYIPL